MTSKAEKGRCMRAMAFCTGGAGGVRAGVGSRRDNGSKRAVHKDLQRWQIYKGGRKTCVCKGAAQPGANEYHNLYACSLTCLNPST